MLTGVRNIEPTGFADCRQFGVGTSFVVGMTRVIWEEIDNRQNVGEPPTNGDGKSRLKVE